MKRTLSFALLILLLLGTNTVYAQKTFFWESFDVDVRLREDGRLDVTEQQTLVFDGGDFTFGFATIPFNRLDSINNITVREGDTVFQRVQIGGVPNTFTVEERSDEIEINWYFRPTQGRHTYTFAYTVEGAVKVEETGSQIFWTAIPSDIPGVVQEANATISVPSGVTILSTTALVNGQEGNAGSTIADDQRSASFSTVNIFPGDTFKIGARFPVEQLELAIPDWQRREALNDTFGLIVLLGSLGLLVGGPIFVLGLWYTRGRDPEAAFSAEYITTPPDDTPPAIVGSLVDEKADMRDILSTVVDLARRGHIHIKEEERDHTYTLLENDSDDLRSFERDLVKALFGSKTEKKLSALKYKFSSKLPSLRKSLYAELVSAGHFRNSPESTRVRYRGLAAVAIFLSIFATFGIGALLADVVDTAFCLGMALIPSGFLLLYVATHMPRKTQAGAEAAAQWEAFRDYLRNIEKYDGLKEANEVFDKYLPYAVAFGFERSWIQKFERLPQPVAPPIWYDPYPRHYGRWGGFGGFGRRTSTSTGQGGGASMPTLEGMSEGMTGGLEGMSQSFTRMLNSTATTMKSVQPSSSSSGSFGGGSFSGGFSGGSSGGGSRGFG